MRISITYLYTIFRYGYPHTVEDALRSLPEIHQLGFRFLEMEGLGPDHLHGLYDNRDRLLSILADCQLHVHNFCVVDPDLVSVDERKRSRALDGFRMGAELAEMLGSETLHLASYSPPVEYLVGKPYELCGKGGYRFANHARIRIPADFDWNRIWRALVDSCRRCTDIAAQYGKTVIMEPRVGEIICSVDSLLRLMEHVDRANFKANFDTAHFCAQRDNVVLALTKLCGRFANIHIADNDPINTEHLPVGDGTIDWREFFRVLKMMDYQGYLGLDLGLTDSLANGYRTSVERIKAIASEFDLSIEV